MKYNSGLYGMPYKWSANKGQRDQKWLILYVGPVVRQNTEWMNEWMNLARILLIVRGHNFDYNFGHYPPHCVEREEHTPMDSLQRAILNPCCMDLD